MAFHRCIQVQLFRSSVFISSILLALASCYRFNAGNVRYRYPGTKYFSQKLDHFNPTNNAEFRQRYLISDEFFNKNGGPIFFYTGNEGDITLFVNNTGFMWDIAPEFSALVVFAEHRYYGKSKPFPDLKPTPENVEKFGQFTVEQALADYVELITHLKKTISGAKFSPVIAFGGSYGGMLAAWLRRKYPHIVTGALAASAPVRFFPGEVDCEAYYKVVTNDFSLGPFGQSCVENIRRSWVDLETIGKQPNGLNTLTGLFHLCDPLKNVSKLENWLSEAWTSLAMVNYPYPTSFLNPLPAWPVQVTCKRLSKPSLKGTDLLNAIRDAAGVFYNYSGQAECFSLTSEASPGLSQELWNFQSCTEMVMPFCADPGKDMFKPSNWSFTEFTKDCQKKFGTVPRENWALLQFGGLDWTDESNVIFSNGMLDPWKVGGILKSDSKRILALYIEDAAHHLDLRHLNPHDPKSVIIARRQEVETIAVWLQNHAQRMRRRSWRSSRRKCCATMMQRYLGIAATDTSVFLPTLVSYATHKYAVQ